MLPCLEPGSGQQAEDFGKHSQQQANVISSDNECENVSCGHVGNLSIYESSIEAMRNASRYRAESSPDRLRSLALAHRSYADTSTDCTQGKVLVSRACDFRPYGLRGTRHYAYGMPCQSG